MLTVVSAGVTRVVAGHTLAIYAAGFLRDEDGSDQRIHEFRLTVLDEELQVLGSGVGAIQINAAPDRRPGEALQLPFVFPVPPITAQVGYRYDVRFAIDDETEDLSFWGVAAPMTPR